MDPIISFGKKALSLGAWILIGFLLSVILLRLIAHDRLWVLAALNMFTLYLYLPAYLILIGALFARKWWLTGFSGLVVLCHLIWCFGGLVLPTSSSTLANTPSLKIMSANVLMVNQDTRGIIQEIITEKPDVLFVQELSLQWALALSDSNAFADPKVRELFPYRIYEPREDSFGIGIYSRLPLDNAEIVQIQDLPFAKATIMWQGQKIQLYNLHLLPPYNAAYKRGGDEQLRLFLQGFHPEAAPTILAGDINATVHNRWYQAITQKSVSGCHEMLRRNLATTWPQSGFFPLPPIRIDHLFLSSPFSCTEIREGIGQGSDHKPLIARITL